VFDCSAGATNGWSITRLIGGSQNGSGPSILAFPDGVAMPVRAHAVLLMNAHYLNASDAPPPKVGEMVTLSLAARDLLVVGA